MALTKRTLGIVFLLSFMSSLCFSNQYKISQCNPNKLLQGSEDVSLTLLTDTKLPQDSYDELYYSSVYFSNPGITVNSVKFINAITMICNISISKTAPLDAINNPIDVEIVSYDKDGIPYSFIGKDIFKLSRKPFINDLIIQTKTGNIIQGEPAKVVLKGDNFIPGNAEMLITWSGLPAVVGVCSDPGNAVFELTDKESAKLKPGKYEIYFYNSDGSSNIYKEKIKVEKNS